jgi:transcriptional regulator with XRE-family HTH domain
MTVRAMRNFRLKHNLSLKEVAAAVGKSSQWLSQLELGTAPANTPNQYKVMQAFQLLILNKQRAVMQMQEDFIRVKRRLMEEEPDWKA